MIQSQHLFSDTTIREGVKGKGKNVGKFLKKAQFAIEIQVLFLACDVRNFHVTGEKRLQKFILGSRAHACSPSHGFVKCVIKCAAKSHLSDSSREGERGLEYGELYRSSTLRKAKYQQWIQ